MIATDDRLPAEFSRESRVMLAKVSLAGTDRHVLPLRSFAAQVGDVVLML